MSDKILMHASFSTPDHLREEKTIRPESGPLMQVQKSMPPSPLGYHIRHADAMMNAVRHIEIMRKGKL